MKKGWCLHCPACNALVFVSRWKWWARIIVRDYNRQARAGMYRDMACQGEVALEWRAA